MKTGYKHKTGYFGTAGEAYCASIFQMARVRDGFSRPDLITIDPKFETPLAVEVKSGKGFKSVVNIGSLFYTILPIKASGEPISISEEEFRELIYDFNPQITMPNTDIARVYFDSLSRKDSLSAKELQNPFSSIRFQWGDQFLVPGEYAFCAFVVSDYMRRGKALGMSLEELVKSVKDSMIHLATKAWDREFSGSHDYQNMNCIDMEYFFERDDDILKRGDSRERVELLRKYYPEVDDLLPFSIPGPNGTELKVLTTKDDLPLFRKLRKVVRGRKTAMEALTRERKEAEQLLTKTRFVWQQRFGGLFEIKTGNDKGVYDFGIYEKTGIDLGDYTKEEVQLLARLQNWLLPGEEVIYLDSSKAVNIKDNEPELPSQDEEEVPF